eukprot:g13534.t1
MEGPTSKASSSSAGKAGKNNGSPSTSPPPRQKQRGIFSEILRQHGEEDVEGCRMGPHFKPAAVRQHGSALARNFQMSDASRSQSNAYLENLQAAGRTKIKPLNGEGKEEKSSADKLIRSSDRATVDGKALDLSYPDSSVVEIGSIEPKVIEVYAHQAGTKPRKVTVERQKRYFASLHPEELFLQRGIDMRDFVTESNRSLRNRKTKLDRKKGLANAGQTLDSSEFDLLDFDDTEYDVRNPQQWMSLIPKPPKGSKKRTGLKAKGLRIGTGEDSEDVGESYGSFEPCVIYAYEGEGTNYFYGLWYDDETPCFLSRLDFFFDGEDPVAYADRVANAFRQRDLVSRQVKFLFYVDNIPTEGIPTLNVDQTERLKKNCRPRNPAGSDSKTASSAMDHFVESLVEEAKLDFGRILNRLSLLASGEAKGLSPLAELEELLLRASPVTKPDHDPASLFFVPLILPEAEIVDSSYSHVIHGNAAAEALGKVLGKIASSKGAAASLLTHHRLVKKVPYYALHPVPAYNFTNVFASFCFGSLFVKPQVVMTLVQIREACLQLEQEYGTKIFQTKFPRNARIDQFRALQQQAITAMLSLCKNWVQDLKKVVVTNFEDVQKGWYSIKEKNAETYKYGKIRKLLTSIRFLMETSMFAVCRASLQAYEQKMVNYTPTKLAIKSLKDVEVEFRTPTPEITTAMSKQRIVRM